MSGGATRLPGRSFTGLAGPPHDVPAANPTGVVPTAVLAGRTAVPLALPLTSACRQASTTSLTTTATFWPLPPTPMKPPKRNAKRPPGRTAGVSSVAVGGAVIVIGEDAVIVLVENSSVCGPGRVATGIGTRAEAGKSPTASVVIDVASVAPSSLTVTASEGSKSRPCAVTCTGTGPPGLLPGRKVVPGWKAPAGLVRPSVSRATTENGTL